MSEFFNAVLEFLSHAGKWFVGLKPWIKIAVLAIFVLGLVGSVAGYSINKRNKIIRENKRIIQKQAHENTMLRLTIQKRDEQLKISKLDTKDKAAASQIEAGRKKLATLRQREQKLQEKRKAIDKATSKDVKKVDGMSVADQIKKMNQVLGDTL